MGFFFILAMRVCNCTGYIGVNCDRGAMVAGGEAVGEVGGVPEVLRLV